MSQLAQNGIDYLYVLLLIAKELAPTVNLILKQLFLRVCVKNHYRRMLCSAIASLNCDAKNFFLSFYSLSNYHKPYGDLIESWNFANRLCESVRPYIKREEYEMAHRFLLLEDDNIMLWWRRIQMQATINEWNILPDREQIYGTVAKAYQQAISRLAY